MWPRSSNIASNNAALTVSVNIAARAARYLQVTASGPYTDAMKANIFDPACPTRQLLDRVGDKWTVLVP